jgi:lycopene beta-cyclase
MKFDAVLVGGGLQSSLVALAMQHHAPGVRVAMVESSQRLGGEHTWCFHEGDVPAAEAAWVEPLVEARWPAWDVRFASLQRTFGLRYAAITSARLNEVVVRAMQERGALFLGRSATAIDAREVVLDDGTVLEATLVVDARGPQPSATAAAFQKFVGLELELELPSTLARPIVMDATVEQRDGFRFFYVLPFTPTRVLVEETFFSDDATLDDAACIARTRAYAESLGLVVSRVVRKERGILPLPLTSTFAPSSASPLVAGYRGGWFHPTTGYSLPIAVRLAAHLARTLHGETFGASWRRLVEGHARQARFAVLLNRLLFGATDPAHRRDVLERFHRLPDASVARFYALETSPADRLRIFCGAPPPGVSIRRALEEVMST